MLENAFRLLDEALPILRESEESVGISDCIRYQAEVSMKKALSAVSPDVGVHGAGWEPVRMDEATALAESALQIATEAGNGMRRVKALRLLGILGEMAGNVENATQQLELSVREAEQLESELEAGKSAYQLSGLLRRMHRETLAEEWLQLARDHAVGVDACSWRERILALS